MREMVDYIRPDGIVTMAGGDGGDGAMKTAMYHVGQFPHIDKQRINDAMNALFPKKGELIRCPGQGWHSNPKCTSRDQTTNWFCLLALLDYADDLWYLWWAHIKRFGFCQNWQTEEGKFQIADHYILGLDTLLGIGLIRGFRIFLFWPMLLILDWFTVGAAIIRCFAGPDDVGDDQDLLCVMYTQSKIYPTPVSWLARKILFNLKKKNYGSAMIDPDENDDSIVKDHFESKKYNFNNSVMGSVWWYHRASQGAPPMHQAWDSKLMGDFK